MKSSKKIRLLLGLTSLLICMTLGAASVNADMIDMNDYYETEEEATTSVTDTITYADGKITLTQVNEIVETYAGSLATAATYSQEELAFVEKAMASQTDLYANFAKAIGKDSCGNYIGHDKAKIVESSDSVIVLSTVLDFENKDIKLTINVKCFDTIGAQVVSTECGLADAGNETLGAKLGAAGMHTLLGMGTVFIVLILISLIISCFNFIPKIQAKFSKKATKEVIEGAAPSIQEAALQKTDDLELIAVITAAIAASENTTTDSFVVRSIRKR